MDPTHLKSKLITIRRKGSVSASGAGSCCLLVCLLLSLVSASQAEQLPIKSFTSAAGLAQDQVSRIVRDSFGFLWFCTSDGLSRFDGFSFSNYTTADGLPGHEVNDLVETRPGVYWVATNKGIARFSLVSPTQSTGTSQLLTAKPTFVTYNPSQTLATSDVNVLLRDQQGGIWCGTREGLFRLEESGEQVSFRFIDLGMPGKTYDDANVAALLKDREGALWVATRGSGLYRYLPDRRVDHYTVKNGLPNNDIRALLVDRQGRLWVGTTHGLCLFNWEPAANGQIVARVFRKEDGLASKNITSLLQSADGSLWVGNFGGLSHLPFNGSNSNPAALKEVSPFRSYTKAQGLDDIGIRALAEDLDGNLWLGSDSSGAVRITRAGFTTFSEADGLLSSRI